MSRGTIYSVNNYIVIEFNNIVIESIASKILKKIKRVVEFDNDGNFVIDTNYGEEHVDLESIIDELDIDIDLEKELSTIDGFEVKDADSIINEKINDAEIKNISFEITKNDFNDTVLIIADIDNPKCKALFMNMHNGLELIESSFPNRKRKYEMLKYFKENEQMFLKEIKKV